MNLRYFIPFVLLTFLIFYLNGVPFLGASISNQALNQIIRKSGHVLSFAILTYLFWKSLPKMDTYPVPKIALSISVLLPLAIGTEAYQVNVPGRCGNFVGFSFNALGILIMMGAFVCRTKS
jgi:VanZ family protein